MIYRLTQVNREKFVPLLALIGIVLVGLLAINQFFLLLFGFVVVGLVGFVILFRLPIKHIWVLWVGMIVVAMFGPLLDVLTQQPVVWLLGMAILGLTVVVMFRQRISLSRVEAVLLLYVAYYFLQVLRPDTNILSNLLLFRQPLIWLCVLWVTRKLLKQSKDIQRTWRQFAVVMIVAGTLAASYGLFQYAAGEERLKSLGLLDPSSWYVTHDRTISGDAREVFRIAGPMRRNETFGFAMVFVIACGISLLQLGIRRRSLLVAALVVCLLALVLSFSIASYFYLAMLLLVLAVTTASAKTRRIIFLRALPAALVAFVLLDSITNGTITGRFLSHYIEISNVASGQNETAWGRLGTFISWGMNIADRTFMENLVGTGLISSDGSLDRIAGILAQFGISDPSTLLSERRVVMELSDNYYAYAQLDTGIIGLFLLLLPLLTVLVKLLPRIRHIQDRSFRAAMWTMGLYVVLMIPQGLINSMFNTMPMPMLFWSAVSFLEQAAFWDMKPSGNE